MGIYDDVIKKMIFGMPKTNKEAATRGLLGRGGQFGQGKVQGLLGSDDFRQGLGLISAGFRGKGLQEAMIDAEKAKLLRAKRSTAGFPSKTIGQPTQQERDRLGIQKGDDVTVTRDATGNIVDYKIISKQDVRFDKLGKAIDKSGIGAVDQALFDIENKVAELLRKKKSLPGIGVIKGRTYDILTSPDGIELRSLISTYVNLGLKERSGAAVTPNELKRFQQELAGAQTTADINVFLDVLQRNRQNIEKQKKQTFALYRDSDVEEYQKRGGISFKKSPFPKLKEQTSKIETNKKKLIQGEDGVFRSR